MSAAAWSRDGECGPHCYDRREFLGRLVVGAGSTGVSRAAIRLPQTSLDRNEHPNVILIITDQQRYDSLGCNGNPHAVTPNIDRLAGEGARFEYPYVSQPVCSPSRSSLLTGLFPHKTGVVENSIPLINHSTSLPRVLHEAGYRTCYIGKWHLGLQDQRVAADPPTRLGPEYFDVWMGYQTGARHWVDPDGNYYLPYGSRDLIVPSNSHETPQFREEPGIYRPDMETDEAIKFIETNRQRPFCLCISYYPPHDGPIAPLERSGDVSRDWGWTASLKNCRRFEGRVEYPTFYAMVNRIDENVGRLVQRLNDLGLRERTILAYTSDHGHYFAKRREEADSFKRLCFDIASRVPLIVNWRGHIKGQVCSRLISNVDLAPTLLDLCRVKVPSEMHGRSARGLLLTGSQDWRQAVFMENRPFGDLNNGIFERCVVTENWKLILSSQREPELYDRTKDREEVHNRWTRKA